MPARNIVWRQAGIEPFPRLSKGGLSGFKTQLRSVAPWRDRERRIDVPFPYFTLRRPFLGKSDPADRSAFMDYGIVVLEQVIADDGGTEGEGHPANLGRPILES